MSESILKALMQLFAIVGSPVDTDKEKRAIVESFLVYLLNQELAQVYLEIFDIYYKLYQQKSKDTEKKRKRISGSSVRILKICTEINEEITQKQKIIVLIRLLEFVKKDNEISPQEDAFISAASEIFHIPSHEYQLIKKFVLNKIDEIPETDNLLEITGVEELSNKKRIYVENLVGKVYVLQVSSAGLYIFTFKGNTELYLNGQLLELKKIHVLNVGASLRNPKIRPLYFSDIVNAFNVDRLKSKIQFTATNIEYKFKNGKIGLYSLSFNEQSGRLVGIMGASGAGKSTLLNVLNGSLKPSNGTVEINGINIHTEAKQLEGVIGYVSQDDLLIEELSVYQNLYYNAKLCFDQYSENELHETVIEMLENLGLVEIKDMKVGSPLNKKISGGQRKRLNIALELIREPSVLFLDEPTSGLSSRDSENIMDMLKQLALKGKLIVTVIHQPSSDIFKMFDRLVILDTGGYLIYNGSPIESILYFKSLIQQADWNESECQRCGNVNPEQIFNIIEAKVIDEYGNLTNRRKIPPNEWNTNYNNYFSNANKNFDTKPALPENSFKIPNRFKQFLVFIKRDLLSKVSNTQYMIINLLEAPLLALILSYLIKYFNVNVSNTVGYTFSDNSNIPVYIFMSVIVAIFIGLSVSAEEIIKDRKILKRESFLNLSRASYLFSKIAILFGLSAIQAFFFVLIGNSIIELRGMYFEFWLVLFSAWSFSNITGLIISDSFKTAVTIYILIPFLVIPQIILSGVLVKFEKLNPKVSSPTTIPWYGEIIVSRWAYEALAVHQFIENNYQRKFYIYDKTMSIAEFKKNFWLKELENKLLYCERNMFNEEKYTQITYNLRLLQNEISKELVNNSVLDYAELNKLNYQNINEDIIENTKNYLALLKRYYIKLYNKANSEKDQLISNLQQTEDDKNAFIRLKQEHHNEKLSEIVRNSSEVDRIIEYNEHLYQKVDPIFMDPSYKFIRAHFYAPRKAFFGHWISTFWINIMVIWIYNLLFFILLYRRSLKRLLEFFEVFSEKYFENKKATPIN